MHVEPIKASMSIEPGPLSASARPALGITQYCWPSYRRVSSYRGGDVTATFSFTARMPEIERWFDAYLGWEFTEYMYGEPTFSGYIASVRMSYRGDVLVKSLDTMANAIAINYEDTNGDQQQSSFSTNAASIARYGRKELIIESPDRLTSGNITTQLAEELGRLAFPRSRISDMAVFGAEIPFNDVPVVEVTVLGWGSTLNWLHYTNAGTGTAAISTIVSTMLTDYDGAGTDVDFVTAGNIETTSEVAPVESSDRPILDRVLSLSDIEDWVAGCFGSRKLDFFDYPDTLIYDRVLKRDGNSLVPLLYIGQNPLNPAQVKPYGYIRTASSFSGQQFYKDIKDNPNVTRISSVEYTASGVKFTTSDRLVNAREDRLSSMRVQTRKETHNYGEAHGDEIHPPGRPGGTGIGPMPRGRHGTGL